MQSGRCRAHGQASGWSGVAAAASHDRAQARLAASLRGLGDETLPIIQRRLAGRPVVRRVISAACAARVAADAVCMAHTRTGIFVALRDPSSADNVVLGSTTVAARLDCLFARLATPPRPLADGLARASRPERVESADGRVAHALARRSVARAVARARRVGSG